MTAGQIVEHFDTTGATISHHLNILRQAGLIEDRKSGKYIYYELNTTVFQEVLSWMHSLMEEDKHEKNNRKISKGYNVLAYGPFVPFIISICFITACRLRFPPTGDLTMWQMVTQPQYGCFRHTRPLCFSWQSW